MIDAAKMRKACLGLVCAFLICAPASGAQQRPWRADDSFRMKGMTALTVSPDQTTLLYVVTATNLAENRSISTIWSMPTKGGEPRQLTDGRRGATSPKWSPDGKRIAYFSSDDEGPGLWIMNRDGSGQSKLTRFERSNAYLDLDVGNALSWSPDGSTLAYTAAGPRHYNNVPSPQDPPNGNDVLITDRLLYKAWYYYSDLRRTHVWTIPASGGKPLQLSTGDHDYHSISWSPDGKRIACLSNRTGQADLNANTDICILSTEGKPMVQLTRTTGPEYHPNWSPDGKKIAYLRRLRGKRSKESDAELKKVFVIDAGGGEAVNLSAPLDRWSASPRWAPDSRSIYFTAQNSGAVGLYTAPASGGRVTPVFLEKGRIGSYAAGGDGSLFAVYSDFTHPAEIYRIRADGGKVRMTGHNEAFVDEVAILDIERFSYESFDGLEIEGWIMRPGGFETGRKYPTILSVHGGPHGQYGYRLSGIFQLYAANGYVVVFTNPRGSSGYGQAFSDMCVGDLGGGDYQDLMTGVDRVIAEYDFIDPDRMGVTGGSYGGYLTNWITTHTNRFKAAVPISSISNLISMWGTCANTLWFESDMGFMPMDDYDRAWAVSPLKYVKNCKTPTLFINGAWDHCTHVNQAEEMYTALKKLGVDAMLAIYPNEGHGVRNQARHTHDYHQRALAWFDKYLKATTL